MQKKHLATKTGAAKAGVRLVKVGSFNVPVYVTSPPHDKQRLFVVSQSGKISVVRGGKRLLTPFLDLSNLTSADGERGLLSLAFAPDYVTSGLFYVYYTARDSGEVRIVEYRRATPDRADAASARVVLSQPHPQPNHNGGLLLFGPDNLLYVGSGDGGGEGDLHGPIGNGQNLNTLLGKLLRIDPRKSGNQAYTIPASNPFVNRPGVRPEIYSWGLRNPWRFSFDSVTRNLVIGDVGGDLEEEVDYVSPRQARGANFGWRAYEGFTHGHPNESAPNYVPPIFTYPHSGGRCAITGGVVVRDRSLSALYGRYLFADLCQGRINSLRLAHPRAVNVASTGLHVGTPTSFGEDNLHRVYVVSGKGGVYRIAAR